MCEKLLVSEIYKSIQGESVWNGWPCVFIRMSGCPLRCNWCDTPYSFQGGQNLSLDEILKQVKALDVPMVELTGGEPLAQSNSPLLLEKLIQNNYKTLIETGGSISIKGLPKETHIIMDLKCPDSKMSHHNYMENIKFLKPSDEIKFVIASRNDFLWAQDIIKEFHLEQKAQLSLSPAWGLVKPKDLCSWLLDSSLHCRLNLQIHKYIWHPRAKGV